MLDGFGRAEKTGVGGRNLVGDSIVRQVAPTAPPSHAYHLGAVTNDGYVINSAPSVAYQYNNTPAAVGYSLAQPHQPYYESSPRPPYRVPSHAPPPPVRPHHVAVTQPLAQYANVAVFDPNIFGDNTTPPRRPAAPQQPVQPSHLHPLEYDGGDAPTAVALPTTLMTEYYNRTRGPVLNDDDRVAIEDFFATDDFTAQFNAQAAARRNQLLQQQQSVSNPAQASSTAKPPHRVEALDMTEGHGSEPQQYYAEKRFPVCHRCHADILERTAAVKNAVTNAKGSKTGRAGGRKELRNVKSGAFR